MSTKHRQQSIELMALVGTLCDADMNDSFRKSFTLQACTECADEYQFFMGKEA